MSNEKKPIPHITLANLLPPYKHYNYFADGEHHPFRHDARGFELVNAWWLSDASTLTYADDAFIHQTLLDKTPLQTLRDFSTPNGTQVFVASNAEMAVVIFRGTESTPRHIDGRLYFKEVILDLHTDADLRTSVFGEGANVHRGFNAGVDQVWEDGGLKDYIYNLESRTIWFTGHSLGGPLATLAAVRSERLDGLYTFGSPRVGDAGFAEAFAQNFAARGLEHYRFVNGNDIITTYAARAIPSHIPYKHVGRLKHIDSNGRIHDSPTRFEELKEKVRSLIPFDESGSLDPRFFNLIPNAAEDHVPLLYSTHIWNAYVDELNGQTP